MKVMLVNGSPHKKGCTYTALTELADTFEKEDIGTKLFWIGNKPLYCCIDCGKCDELGRCVFEDRVNEFLQVAGDYDGFIFASPVHYAGATEALTSFMGRAFFADLHSGKNRFYLKPPRLWYLQGGPGQRPHWIKSINSSFGDTCRLFPRATGIWCMAAPRKRSERTGRECETSVCWQKTWRGSCAARKPEKSWAFQCPNTMGSKRKHLSATFEAVRGDVRITKEQPL